MLAATTRPVTAPVSCPRSAALMEHAPLVRRIANRLRTRLPASVALDELVQAGMIGLHEALGRYDSGRGGSFSTYASRRIEGAMLDALRDGDPLPRSLRERQRAVRSTAQTLEHRLLRPPRTHELAGALGWSLAALHRCLGEAQPRTLADPDAVADAAPAEAGPEASHGAPDEAADPLHRLQQRQRETALHLALATLEARERRLMELLYDQGLEHRDVASVLGVTPSRVSQLHAGIVAKLRRRLRDW